MLFLAQPLVQISCFFLLWLLWILGHPLSLVLNQNPLYTDLIGILLLSYIWFSPFPFYYLCHAQCILPALLQCCRTVLKTAFLPLLIMLSYPLLHSPLTPFHLPYPALSSYPSPFALDDQLPPLTGGDLGFAMQVDSSGKCLNSFCS